MSDFDAAALAIVRRAYARQMLAMAGVENPALENAFAAVPRERFLGPPPWTIWQFGTGYQSLPRSDPVLVYQDVLFALAPSRGVNNGSPSLHAKLLHHLAPRVGARVVHIGAGTGYYTALLAELVGPTGRVLAVEVDPTLAAQARANLAGTAAIEVVADDGAAWPRDEADAIYVNFGVERPADAWIERLAPDGRLIFALGVPTPSRIVRGTFHSRHGAAFIVTRERRGLSARTIGPAYFVCAEGTPTEGGSLREALAASFERGGIGFVQSLRWKTALAPERSWFTGEGWSLSYDPVPL